MTLSLEVRTPSGLCHSGPVLSIRAEDLDGWVGIRPGRRDLVLALPPGILSFVDDRGEGFVANAGGMLLLERDRCRVVTPVASLHRDPGDLGRELSARDRARRERTEREPSAALIREAILRATTGRGGAGQGEGLR